MRNRLVSCFMTALFAFLAGSLFLSPAAQAAHSGKGQVIVYVQAGQDPCPVLKDILKEPESCNQKDLPGEFSAVAVKGSGKMSAKEGASVILKISGQGKSTGKVIGVYDLPVGMDALKDLFQDRKSVVLWLGEDNANLIVIEPDKAFTPEKDQRIRIKIKEPVKLEGC